MQLERDQNLETSIAEELVREPTATAKEIARHLGCKSEQITDTSIYRRVVLARFARDPAAVDEFVHFARSV